MAVARRAPAERKRGLRKSSWAMLIWTGLCAVLAVLTLSAESTTQSVLPLGQAVKVDNDFRVTFASPNPPTFKIDNLTSKNAYFSYSDIAMIDSAGTEHEPRFALGQIGEDIPASASITKTLDFGNLGTATPKSFIWECDACEAGQSIGRGIGLFLIGGIYWFGMLVLFVIWMASRPPQVVYVAPANGHLPDQR
jgi:hypothetical protein